MRKLVEIYFKGRQAPVVVDFEGEWPTQPMNPAEALIVVFQNGKDRRLRIVDYEDILAVVEVPVVPDTEEVWTSPEGEDFSGPRETV